jgi:hypothetical protein
LSSADLIIAAGYVAIAGVAGLLAYFATLRLTRWRGIGRSVAAFVAAATTACGLGLLVGDPPVADVRIDSPAGAAVAEGVWITVEGTVSPPDAAVQVLVHPSSAEEQPWWVQPAPAQGRGAWRANIHLGTAREGEGDYFQIVAVASPRPRLFDLLHRQWLDEAQTLEQLPALPRSEIVTVWRAR